MDTAAVLAKFDEQMRRHSRAERGTRTEIDAHITRVLTEVAGWNGVVWSDLSDHDADVIIDPRAHLTPVLPAGVETLSWLSSCLRRPDLHLFGRGGGT